MDIEIVIRLPRIFKRRREKEKEGEEGASVMRTCLPV